MDVLTGHSHLPANLPFAYKYLFSSTEKGYAHNLTFTPKAGITYSQVILHSYYSTNTDSHAGGWLQGAPPIFPPCSELTVFSCAD